MIGNSFELCFIIDIFKSFLRWLIGLTPIQREQQKTQLPLIILAKNLKPILWRVIKGT